MQISGFFLAIINLPNSRFRKKNSFCVLESGLEWVVLESGRCKRLYKSKIMICERNNILLRNLNSMI